ncbi:MAG: tripartite tricarboxylate transporter substrate binding protein [Burkholderiales bacterium]|nr:tripartite tricarboxylate transporter substrate binding protein [Burkholderiales bacterium]
MKMKRVNFVRRGAGLPAGLSIVLGIVLCGMLSQAWAQDAYPTRPVRIIAPTSPGSGSDIMARLIAQGLTDRLGRQVLVENRAGAGTVIGNQLVAKAAPDGYTLLMGVSTLAINPSFYKNLPYDAPRDFAPITLAVFAANLVVAHPSVPATSLKQFIAFAKARPDQIHYASAGYGTNPHLAMELLANMAGIRMIHVPYKGDAPSIVDLIGGQIALTVSPLPRSLPHVRAGRLRVFGITSATRGPAAPDIPTIAEAGLPGYEAVQWYGLLAPAGTPRDIITRLNKETIATLRAPENRERIAEAYVDVMTGSPEEFAAFIKAETAKWGKVAKAVGIVPE